MFTTPGALGVVSARGQRFFGTPIGVLLLDCTAPWIPGSVGNASTFSAPVTYKTMTGLTVDAILGPKAGEYTHIVVDTARALVAEGAQMITAGCGFSARYQASVQAAVDVPVLLSSLLLVPFLQAMLPESQKLGVLTAVSTSMSPEFITSTGLNFDHDRMVMAGIDDAPAFDEAFIACGGSADVPAIRQELVKAACNLTARNEGIGALLLECSEFPPYASAIQQATGLPVFDYTSLIEFFAGGLRRAAFDGYY